MLKRLFPFALLLLGSFIPSLRAATTVRSTNTNSATTGTAVSVTAPSGTTTGDVVICLVHVNGQTTIVDNNGSTPFTEDINDWKPNTTSGMTVSVFSRRIQAGDPTTYNFTSGLSGRWSIIAITFQNPHASVIYDVAPSTANGANTDSPPGASSVVVPSITTVNNNAIHVTTAYQDGATAGTVTYPSGYSNTVSTNSGSQISAATKVITSAGATGTTTFSWNRTDAVMGVSFAIRDEGVGLLPAYTNVTNTFTAQQNFDANVAFKGPNPYIDLSRYGSYGSAVQTPPSTTANCTSTSTSVTLASAQDFANGHGIRLDRCGSATLLNVPPAPTVTPVYVTGGATTYNYKWLVEDRTGGLTAASGVGTTTTGVATLGLQNITLTQGVWTNTNGGTQTYTCSANCNLQAGAVVQVSGFTGAGAGFFNHFNGNFTVTSVPTSTTFTVLVPSPNITPQVTTDATGGTAQVYACNRLTLPTNAVPNSIENGGGYLLRYWVYRNNVLAFPIVGHDPFFEDCGFNATNMPSYVSTMPPGAAQNGYLVTTIVSGGGTTSIVVANAAGATQTGVTALHDNTPNLINALTASSPAASGVPVRFPLGAGFIVFNSTADIKTAAAGKVFDIQVTTGTLINNPWILGNALIEGFPQKNSSSFFPLSVAELGGNGYPILYNDQGAPAQLRNLIVNATNATQPTMYVDQRDNSGSFQYSFLNTKFVNTTKSNVAVAIFKGVVFSNWKGMTGCEAPQSVLPQACFRFTTLSSATAGASGYTSGGLAQDLIEDFLYSGAGAGIQIDNIPAAATGVTGTPGTLQSLFLKKGLGEQRWGPLVRVQYANLPNGVVHLEQWNDDAPNTSVSSSVFDNAYPANREISISVHSATGSGAQVLVAGPGVITNFGLPLQYPLGGTETGSSSQRSFTGLGNSQYSLYDGSQLINSLPTPGAPISCMVSAGGAVPVGTHTYSVAWYDVNNNLTIPGPPCNATTTSGNQTVTVTPPASVPSGVAGAGFYRDGALTGPSSTICGPFPVANTFVDTLGFAACGNSANPITKAGASGMSLTQGIWTDKLRVGQTQISDISPYTVYTTVSASTNASIPATTMATASVSGNTYRFTFYIDQTALGSGCTGNTNITPTVTYTDPNGASPQSFNGSATTIVANGTLGAIDGYGFVKSLMFRAKASTAVQYSTTYFAGAGCTTGPRYQVYPVLEVIK